jgi:hypothetical protein
MWVARRLWESWPPRRSPRAVRLHRRPDATAEQWQDVLAKLEIARAELAEAGIPIRIDWAEKTGSIAVDVELDRQLSLIEGAA